MVSIIHLALPHRVSVNGDDEIEGKEAQPQMRDRLSMMELIGPGTTTVNRLTPFLAATQKNVHVALQDTLDVLTFECSIPLKGRGYLLGAAQGATISLRLETGEMKMPNRTANGGQGVSPQGMGGGGMGGGRGRMGGGGGSFPGGGSYGSSLGGGGMPQPLQFTARVKLAANSPR